MSQQRLRKASVAMAGEGGACPRGLVPKASGDTVSGNIRPKQQPQRSGSKNKIPKSMRYDLENALVGLCDVWFEDIKPHLVRNNIKVHVHGGSAVGAASGDYSRPPAPRAAPGCVHLDPGAATDHRQRQAANCADFYSTQPTASRAPCRRPHVLSPSRPPPPPPSPPSPLETCTQNHRRNYEDPSESRSRQKSCSSKTTALVPNWRVPRLCRTNTVISPSATPRPLMRRIQTAMPPQSPPRDDSFFQFIQPRRRVKMKHKSTQTEHLSCWGRAAHAALRPAPAPFGRCPATTTFFPPRYKTSEYREYPLRTSDEPLFKQDLVNIIGEKNDKQIKLLYKYQKKEEEYPSVMNLLLSADDGPTEPCGFKKKPWR